MVSEYSINLNCLLVENDKHRYFVMYSNDDCLERENLVLVSLFVRTTCAFCDGVTRQHIAVLDNIANSVKAFR